ncbi:hypothetical protein [Poseidonocella sp. HB161398]|uniref:hypothetical protein n=1 Tax=Poseidonocella sp. HB161398 TaxID=2320855 RepID=UPI001485CFEB|nr:hypothetical protein [Poseidonocella sp. HB161398]
MTHRKRRRGAPGAELAGMAAAALSFLLAGLAGLFLPGQRAPEPVPIPVPVRPHRR